MLALVVVVEPLTHAACPCSENGKARQNWTMFGALMQKSRMQMQEVSKMWKMWKEEEEEEEERQQRTRSTTDDEVLLCCRVALASEQRPRVCQPSWIAVNCQVAGLIGLVGWLVRRRFDDCAVTAVTAALTRCAQWGGEE